jgi:hypothetical protein
MSIQYEVQEFCLCDGWVNNWSYEDWAGNTVKTLFDSKEDAEAELEYFFEQYQFEFESGNIEDAPTREDFRIVEVSL